MHRAGLCLLLCLVAGCRDDGKRAWEDGRAQYEALVLKGTRPEAKEWDAVKATLEQVPESSKHHAQAQRLLAAIAQSRVRLRAPLAVASRTIDGGKDPDVIAAREECVRLARERADGGVTPELVKALDACRDRAERLDAAHVHTDGHGDGH